MPDANGMPTEAEWLEGRYPGAQEDRDVPCPVTGLPCSDRECLARMDCLEEDVQLESARRDPRGLGDGLGAA